MLARVILGLIKFYQVCFSPLLGQQCRFYPTCSHYATEAIVKHGAIKGLCFTTHRLLRCHPWCAGGHDPIP